MSSRLLLITGATGLIGSDVAVRALASGYKVRALVRDRSAPLCQSLASQGVELVEGNLVDGPSLTRATRDVEYVVHAAGLVGVWGESALYRPVNVDGLMKFLDALVLTPSLKRMVAVSSLGVYAPRNHYGTDEKVPVYLGGNDGYDRSKTEAELIIREYMRLRNLPAVIVRPGYVYGPRDRHILPKLIPEILAGTFTYLGNGQRLMDNTGVHNLTAAVLRALDTPGAEGETFNVTDERLVTRVELVETIARCLGVAPPRRFIPDQLARPLVKGFERLGRVLGGRQTSSMSPSRYTFLALERQFSIEKAKNLLQYRAQHSFEDGMQEAVDWYRQSRAS